MVIKKILIIGGFGYLGSHLSSFFFKKGYHVDVFSKSKLKHFQNYNKLILGNILNQDDLKSILQYKYDLVLNLISLDKNDSKINSINAGKINVLSKLNVLDLLSKKNNPKLYINFSTIHVYSKNNKLNHEDSLTEPDSEYAMTHLISEKFTSLFYKNQFKCISIRLSNSYGAPHLIYSKSWDLVVNNFCLMAYKKNNIIINSDGQGYIDFIYIKDICEGVFFLVNNYNKLENQVYNLTSFKSVKILTLAKKVSDIYEKRYKKEVKIKIKNSIGKHSNYKKEYSNIKINELGFKINYTLGEGINEIFDFLDKNGKLDNNGKR